jgi:hypothetical protein
LCLLVVAYHAVVVKSGSSAIAVEFHRAVVCPISLPTSLSHLCSFDL